jgi:CBS domain-containing protein
MEVIKLCRHNAVTISPREDLIAAARLMRERHVGYLVVTEPVFADGEQRPIGVLTDRDIVVKVLAKERDPRTLRVGDVMTRDPVLAMATDPLAGVLASMRRIGVRRIPVVGHRGQLIGVLSFDEVIDALSGELSDVAGSIRNEQQTEEALGA